MMFDLLIKSNTIHIIHNNITVFVLGCLFIFFIYHITLIIQNKDVAIIYYSLYVLFLIFYFSLKYEFNKTPYWYTKIVKFLNYPIQPLIWVFYVSFVKKILSLENTLPKLNSFLKYVIGFLLGTTLLFIIVKNLININTYKFIMGVFGVIALLVAFSTNVIIFFNLRSKIVTYYLIGSTLFLTQTTLAFYLTINKGFKTFIAPISYMQLGSIIEIFMFSLIIAYKIRKEKEKKEELEILYQQKLNEINILQQKIAKNLELKNIKSNVFTLEDLNNVSTNKLTKREFDILKQVSLGYSNKEIAEKLFISLNTVKFHLKNIFDKLDVTNRIQASQFFNNK